MVGTGVIVIFFLIAGIIGAIVAGRKGRSKLLWFLLCAMLPILVVVVAVLSQSEASGKLRKCPYCVELVKVEAIVCKHCGKDLPANNPEKTTDKNPNNLPPLPIFLGVMAVSILLMFVMASGLTYLNGLFLK